jgi:hypothetical protein
LSMTMVLVVDTGALAREHPASTPSVRTAATAARVDTFT